MTKADIETANKLAHDVLGRSLDELPPQTRTLLRHIHRMVTQHCQAQGIEQSAYRFSRRDVRGFVGWTDFQIKKHMGRLQEMEYLLVHRGGRGQSFVYELLYQGEGDNGKPFLLGLSNMETLSYDANKEPLNQKSEPSSSPQVAAKEPPSSTGKNAPKPDSTRDSGKDSENRAKKVNNHTAPESYRSHNPLAASPVEV